MAVRIHRNCTLQVAAETLKYASSEEAAGAEAVGESSDWCGEQRDHFHLVDAA